MDISFSYTISWDDFIDSQITYNRNSTEIKKNIRKTRISLASFYSFIILVTYPALNGYLRIIALSLIFFIGIGHILYVARLNEIRVRRLANKARNQANIEKIIGLKKISISENEITYKEKIKTTKIEIGKVRSILESAINYYIFVDETSAIILPKKYENEMANQAKIIEYIKEKMQFRKQTT